MKVSRVVRGYRTDSDEASSEIPLPDDVSLDLLRKVVGCGQGDPMYDSYALDEQAVAILRAELGLNLKSAGMDYYLEAFDVGEDLA